MKTQQNDRFVDLIRGVVTGFVVGGMVALWNAPQSGAETRRQIRARLDAFLHRMQGETVEDSIEMGKAIAHQKQTSAAP